MLKLLFLILENVRTLITAIDLLDIYITDSSIRPFFCRVPRYRFSSRIDFTKRREESAGALREFWDRWYR